MPTRLVDCSPAAPEHSQQYFYVQNTFYYWEWVVTYSMPYSSKVEIHFNMHTEWLVETIKDDELRSRFKSLRNKTIGCWCKADEACHANVIIRLLDNVRPLIYACLQRYG